MLALRPYQSEAVESLFKWWAAGRAGENPLVVLPTAAGKTVVFSALIKRLISDYPGVSVLILAHRKELIAQAEERLLSVWPTAPVGVYAASLGRRELRPITIASRDTIAPVASKIGAFNFVIVDEAHNIAPGEETRYRQIFDALRETYEHLNIIGFTATPYRTGQGYIHGRGQLFAGVAYEKKIGEMIKEGWLCPVTARHGSDDATAQVEDVRTVAGDFDRHQLEEIATADRLIEASLDEWQQHAYDAGRRHSVFYCVSVLHAQLISESLQKRGHDVPVVHGGTPQTERDEILKQFYDGHLVGIANVGVLTEGWDAPRLDCVVLMRPTRSPGLYVQMVGRGLRLHPSKKDTLVLDFAGNIARLGPIDAINPPKYRGGQKREAVLCEICNAMCKRCGEWDSASSAWVGGCGEHNSIAARECHACGAPFIKHYQKAAKGGVLTDDTMIKEFEVDEVSAMSMIAMESGREYLRIFYRISLFEVFGENLFLGYDGYAGQKSANRFVELTGCNWSQVPVNPAAAMRALEKGEVQFRPVHSIRVNLASRWKDVVNVNFVEIRRVA